MFVFFVSGFPFSSLKQTTHKKSKQARSLKFTFRYINDVLFYKQSKLLWLRSINISELEILIKKTDTASFVSSLDLYLKFDVSCYLSIRVQDTRDLIANILKSPAYGIYIFQIIWYPRTCRCYSYLVKRPRCLTRMLMNQGFVKTTEANKGSSM